MQPAKLARDKVIPLALYFFLRFQPVLATDLNIVFDNRSIIDDCTAHDKAEDIVKFLDFMIEKLPGIGLSINMRKSTVFRIKEIDIFN